MWAVMPGQALRHHSWDGEAYVLYNDLSGDTHLLDGAAIEVLMALRQQACGTEALAHQLGLGEDDVAGLADLLDELSRLALVDRVAC